MTHTVRRSFVLGAIVVFAFLFFFYGGVVDAATIQVYSDRLSDSAPSASANHTITLTTTRTLSPGGYVEFTPDPGLFTIPATSTFDIDNVQLLVDTGSGFVNRSLATTTSATEEGVDITPGSSGDDTI